MPWKRCPLCNGLSYSAATNYEVWLCPYCENDISSAPECQPERSEQVVEQSKGDSNKC